MRCKHGHKPNSVHMMLKAPAGFRSLVNQL
jgi:hypothetical protein